MGPLPLTPSREGRGSKEASGFGGGSGDRNLARFGLLAGPWRADLRLFGFGWRLAVFSVVRTALTRLLLTALLVLLRRLVHRIQDAEIVFRVLEIAFRHDAIAATGRIAPELEILLEQLLRRSADAEIRAVAVKHMVAVQRDPTVGAAASAMMAQSATATSAATRSMATSTHALHVHIVAVQPSLFAACGLSDAGYPKGVPGSAPLARHQSIGIGSGEYPGLRPGCLGQATVRLTLPTRKLNRLARPAKRFFHGSAAQHYRAGYPCQIVSQFARQPGFRGHFRHRT